MPSICLCMIVKNEEAVIERSLRSVAPLIDCALILDTGSTDFTKELASRVLGEDNVPHQIYTSEWVNFAANRNAALDLARGMKTDYILVMDADDWLEPNPEASFGMIKEFLDEDVYDVEIQLDTHRYWRPQLFKSIVACHYVGEIHEYLEVPAGVTRKDWQWGRIQATTQGARSRNPFKYRDDAEALEREISNPETPPFLRARYTFYCAQSYLDAGMLPDALYWYKKAVEVCRWNEERCVAAMRVGSILETMGCQEEPLDWYLKAHEESPYRVEPLFFAGRRLNQRHQYHCAKVLLDAAQRMPWPSTGLFLNDWVFTHGISEERKIASEGGAC